MSYSVVAAHYGLNYASLGHDTGHTSTGLSQTSAYDASTGQLKMEQIVDWASRSQHVVTVDGKQLTTAFYASNREPSTSGRYRSRNECETMT